MSANERLAGDLPPDVIERVGMFLNPPLPGKDFKSLAGKMGMSYLTLKNIERESNPTGCLFNHWLSSKPTATVGTLINLLMGIGRIDVKNYLEEYRYADPKVKENSSDYASDDAHSTSSLPYTLPLMGLPSYSFATASSATTSSTVCADDDQDTDEELDRKLRSAGIEHEDPSYDEMLHPQYQFRRSSTISNSTASSAYTSDRPSSLHSPPEGDIAPSMSFTRQPVIPTDKIALVIGNQHYLHVTHLQPLNYVHYDAYNFSLSLRSLGFRVISLVDLTLHEMRTMMLSFSRILGPGVFAVFYFAGHGFEEDGNNYLMPVDAKDTRKASEFIAAQEILKEMQLRETLLNLFIIDACRLNGVNTKGEVNVTRPIRKVPIGNTIIAYSCQTNMPSFETAYQQNGVYMTELLKHICEDRRIEMILMDVTSAVNQNKFVWQRPVVETDAIDECRLTTPVDGNNRARYDPDDYWDKASIPPDDELFVRDEGVDFRIKFKEHFSNMMDMEVWAQCHRPGGVELRSCNVHSSEKEVMFLESSETSIIPKGKDFILLHKFRLLNLQRIRSTFFFVMEMKFCNNNEIIPINLKCDLGWPMVSGIFYKWFSPSRKETAV